MLGTVDRDAELAQATEVAQRMVRRGRKDLDDSAERILGALMRRGYSAHTARDAIRAAAQADQN
jgi:SOS response regulatory protein OraA/RecX